MAELYIWLARAYMFDIDIFMNKWPLANLPNGTGAKLVDIQLRTKFYL